MLAAAAQNSTITQTHPTTPACSTSSAHTRYCSRSPNLMLRTPVPLRALALLVLLLARRLLLMFRGGRLSDALPPILGLHQLLVSGARLPNPLCGNFPPLDEIFTTAFWVAGLAGAHSRVVRLEGAWSSSCVLTKLPGVTSTGVLREASHWRIVIAASQLLRHSRRLQPRLQHQVNVATLNCGGAVGPMGHICVLIQKHTRQFRR